MIIPALIVPEEPLFPTNIWFKMIKQIFLSDVNCGGLTPIQDGDVTLVDDRTTHGAKAVYSCQENYTLVGDAERMCIDDGIWSGEAPKCLFDWCPEPPPVTGAVVTVDGHKAGSLATYSCQNGFILFGPPVSAVLTKLS